MNRFMRHAALVVAFAAATTAWAQYTGPGAQAPASKTVARTVAEVLQDAADDRPVVLTGNLVEQTGRELFLFRDATGEIVVEIDAEDFPAGHPIGPDARVQIEGEIEARWMRKPRIEVERLRPAADATPAATP